MEGGIFEQIAKGGFYVPAAADSGLSGTVVGNVELVRLLASGATSNVWEGRRRTDGVPVAIKFACRSGDAGLKARFEHETEMLAEVLSSELEGVPEMVSEEYESPFPRYYGSGEYEGRPYIVTELLEKCDMPGESGAFHDFFLEALEAVEALHARGYIHQDLKPSNMMRRRETGKLVLIDFGQAHKIEEGRIAPRTESLTMDSSGRRMATGTAGYCAPEQLDAERTAFLPATDVYALGMLIRNFCRGMSEWRDVANDATDPDIWRRIPDVEALKKQVQRKEFTNQRNAVRVVLRGVESRRTRRGGQMNVSWEKLVSMELKHRQRLARIGAAPQKAMMTMEELGGKLPGLGIGVEEFGPVRIFVISGSRFTVGERLHLTDSALVRVFGSGALEMDVSAERDVVFVISGDCTVVNAATRQTGIEYFVNDGALLCFPNIPESKSQEIRKHVHLASFDGTFVQFGTGRSRDEVNDGYRKSWEAAMASGDSKVLSLLRESRFAEPDRGVALVLRRR